MRAVKWRASPVRNGLMRRPEAQLSGTRDDVFVCVEEIFRVPATLHLNEAVVVGAIGGADTLFPFLGGEEIDVGATGGEGAQVAPGRADPVDIIGVGSGILPGAGDDEGEGG